MVEIKEDLTTLSVEKLIEMYQQCNNPRKRKELLNLIYEKEKKIVYYIINNIFKKCDEDLIQWGILGLLEAINRFDIEKGCKFNTYLSYYIINESRKYINSETNGLGIKGSTLGNISKYLEKIGVDPVTPQQSNEDIIKMMKAAGFSITPDLLCSYLSTLRTPLRLDEPFSPDDLSNGTISEIVGFDDPMYEEKMLMIALEQILPDKEKEAICLYFGIGTGNKLTQLEIGNMLGITHQEVSRRINNGIKKLRKALGVQPRTSAR